MTGPEGVIHERATVQVIGATLRVIDGPSIVHELIGVDTIDRMSQRAWRITMVDGSTWAVERGKGCGCGGG